MSYTTIFFDLDDTLYVSDSGLWNAIRDRMGLYMHERLAIPEEEIPRLRMSYFETYGTTLRGLQHHHEVDSDDFLAYVHDLPLQEYLQPNPALAKLLKSLPQKRWILTNADAAHASRVTASLGLTGCFDGIVDVKTLGYVCKPAEDAYRRALAIAGETDPTRCVFLDDSARNLAPAHQLGFFTVLVGTCEPNPAADLSILSLSDLPAAFPELWQK